MADDLTERLTGWLTQRGVTAYLVGGYVRDLLLGRPIYDIDVAVHGDAVTVARHAANALGGAFYVLDVERGTARVLLRTAGGTVREVDFARLKDGDLLADLSARDFTVNAMAILPTDRDAAHVIDPHGGRIDLRERRLRVVSPRSIADDPIRILRALRLSGELGLDIEPVSSALIREATPLLARESVERIRDEWCRILCLPSATTQSTAMHSGGILWAILRRFGIEEPGADVREERFGRALGSLAALHALFAPADDTAGSAYRYAIEPYRARLLVHLAEFVADHRSRLLLLRFVALLQPLIGSDTLLTVLTGLHVSTAEVRRARTLCEALAMPMAWIAAGQVSRGTLHGFYRVTGDCGPDVLVLCLARVLGAAREGEDSEHAAAQSALIRRALQAYFDEYETIVTPPRLIDGHTLLAQFDLRPGPQFRSLLESVGEAQAEGLVTSRDEALCWVKHLLATTGAH